MIILPRSVCIDLNQVLNKEWVVANGIGGFASSTPAGINTRRYHALLVASLQPPVGRTVLLSNIDEDIEIDGRSYYIGANEYPDGKVHPSGFVYIEEFRLRDNIPTTVFRLGDSVLHKTVWMEHGHNTTYIRYVYADGESELSMALHPMCNYRDYHGMTHGSLDWNFGVETLPGGCKVAAHKDAAPFWLLSSPEAGFTATGVWYWNFVYRREVDRGYKDKEDLYVPGIFRAVLRPGESFTLVASAEPPETTMPLVANALERERSRQAGLLRQAGISLEAEDGDAADPNATPDAFRAQLVRAADTFMVMRDVEVDGKARRVPSVIAGYHWFADWGRDTMIALPGLALPTGRAAEAAETIRAFALFVREGLLPNNFPDAGSTPDYNTVDATLWMFQAIASLTEAAGDLTLVQELYPVLSDIIAWHVRGTRYNIRMDPHDGLLSAGEPGVQLTWMDAKVDGWVVTPRTGKPVEINALWHNALRLMAGWRKALGRNARPGKEERHDCKALAKRARDSFRERFWYEEGGYLYDVVDGPDGDDPSLRPNQLLALSLDPDLVGKPQALKILDAVRRNLLTPYGPRTLSPDDPEYKGTYKGDRAGRDGAYHQGTAWTWLLGPYFDALRAVEGNAAAGRLWSLMLPYVRAHLADAGLGTISEIFDAEAPYAPRGCVSQAWSVSELLRIMNFEL